MARGSKKKTNMKKNKKNSTYRGRGIHEIKYRNIGYKFKLMQNSYFEYSKCKNRRIHKAIA